MSSYVICSIIQSLNFVIANSSVCLIKAAPTTQKPKIICIDELDKMPRQFQEKLLSFMETGHIKVDQMHKHYDFKIKGAKVFGACNEIAGYQNHCNPGLDVYICRHILKSNFQKYQPKYCLSQYRVIKYLYEKTITFQSQPIQPESEYLLQLRV